MSKSRWLFTVYNYEDRLGLNLNESYVNEFIASDTDYFKCNLSCFDRCLEDIEEFNYNKNCMKSCVNLSTNFFNANLPHVKYLPKSRSVPMYNSPPAF